MNLFIPPAPRSFSASNPKRLWPVIWIPANSLLSLLVFLCICSAQSFAQFNSLDFERLSVTEGMPTTPISGIVQDNRGYMWIGTPTGLFRYNGNSSKYYFYDGSMGSLPDNTIQQIEYIDDKVICLTPGGSFVHNCKTEKDTSLFLAGSSSIPAYLVNNMTDVCSDGHGGLILLSRSGFMHVDSMLEKQYEYIHQDTTESLSISTSFGRIVMPMPDNRFVITGNHGLYVYDPLNKSTTPVLSGMYPVLDTFIDDRSINVFELKSFEYLLISRYQSTLLYYDVKQGLHYSLPIGTETMDLLRWNTQLQSINDSLYYLLMPGKGTMSLMTNKSGQQMKLGQHQSGGILPVTMFADHSHRLWLGTHNGIYKQREHLNSIRKSAPVFDAALPDKSHVQFAVLGPYLVTGTAEGLEMKFYDKITLSLVRTVVITPPDPTYTSTILHFATYGNDSILICTNGPRIWLNTKTWTYQPIDAWTKIPKGFAWYAFQSVLDGTLYTIHNNSTLERYDPVHRAFVSIPLDRDVSKLLRTPTQIAEDWNGDLWLMHQGFCIYRRATGQIDYCRQKFPGAWLHRNAVGNLVMDSTHKVVWFALQRNGLIRYDLETQSFLRFTPKEGLPDIVISQMILVDQHIWMITPSGLASISIDDYSIRRYPYGSGAFLHYSRKALTYDPDTDQLYFMHEQDVMACRPDALLNRSGIAQLLIEQIESGDSLWHWPEQSKIEIHGTERRLRIQLSCVSYEDTAPLQYSYRFLEGRDTTWRNIGMDGITLIENLRPGKHDIQFRLTSTGNDITPVNKSIRIQVYPVFWETSVFRGFLALIVLAGMWLAFRWQYQKKKARTDLDRRMTTLELQALRSRLNPHFIFNCLNSINRYILKEDKGKASYYLSQFAKLIRHTLDYTTESNVSLADELNVTRLYVELESLRMTEPIQLDIQLDPEIEPENIRVPPLFIQPYVENAIWHGLAPKKENLRLWVRVIKQPGGFTFEIEDNGVGRASSAQKNNQGQHVSKGLAIAKETFERYGQVYSMKTKVEIVDLFGSNNLPIGTCVKLSLESVV